MSFMEINKSIIVNQIHNIPNMDQCSVISLLLLVIWESISKIAYIYIALNFVYIINTFLLTWHLLKDHLHEADPATSDFHIPALCSEFKLKYIKHLVRMNYSICFSL